MCLKRWVGGDEVYSWLVKYRLNGELMGMYVWAQYEDDAVNQVKDRCEEEITVVSAETRHPK